MDNMLRLSLSKWERNKPIIGPRMNCIQYANTAQFESIDILGCDALFA